MSNYYTLKNSVIQSPPDNEVNFGTVSDNFGNLYLDNNVFYDNSLVIDSIKILPKIIGLSYEGEAYAANIGGGETVTIRGNGFKSNLKLRIANVLVASNTVVNSSTVTFTAPARSAGNYTISIENSDGGVAFYTPGIDYSPKPVWVTNTFTLTEYETNPVVVNLSAVEQDIPQIFSIASGSLPGGLTLASNGRISGTLSGVASLTTRTANIAITDYQNQKSYRSFTFEVLPDEITWDRPAQASVYNYIQGDTVSIEFLATSLTGRTPTHSADNLPTGLSVVQPNPIYWWEVPVISGIITSTGTQTVTLNAALTSVATATRTIQIISQAETITWDYPANGEVFSYTDGDNIGYIGFSAYTNSGRGVAAWSAIGLPNGLVVDGAGISGTISYGNTTTANISITARAQNSVGTWYNRSFVISIQPGLNFSNAFQETTTDNASRRVINFGSGNYVKYTDALQSTGRNNTLNNSSGNAGQVTVAMWAGLVEGGTGWPIVPPGFQTVFTDSLAAPRIGNTRDETAASGYMCVGVYIRLVTAGIDNTANGGTGNPNFFPPGYPGYAPTRNNASSYPDIPCVNHSLYSFSMKFTKPINGWNIQQVNYQNGFVNNYQNYPYTLFSTSTNMPVGTPSMYIGMVYDGQGKTNQPGTPTISWGAWHQQGQLLNGANFFYGARSIAKAAVQGYSPWVFTMPQYSNAQYNIIENNSTVYGVNVGITSAIVNFY